MHVRHELIMRGAVTGSSPVGELPAAQAQGRLGRAQDSLKYMLSDDNVEIAPSRGLP